MVSVPQLYRADVHFGEGQWHHVLGVISGNALYGVAICCD